MKIDEILLVLFNQFLTAKPSVFGGARTCLVQNNTQERRKVVSCYKHK